MMPVARVHVYPNFPGCPLFDPSELVLKTRFALDMDPSIGVFHHVNEAPLVRIFVFSYFIVAENMETRSTLQLK